MYYILLKDISKLFDFVYNQKLYQCYQFVIINSNNAVLSYIYIWNYLTMSNITKFEFVALDILGKNYLSWIFDVKIHLNAINLGITIKEGN